MSCLQCSDKILKEDRKVKVSWQYQYRIWILQPLRVLILKAQNLECQELSDWKRKWRQRTKKSEQFSTLQPCIRRIEQVKEPSYPSRIRPKKDQSVKFLSIKHQWRLHCLLWIVRGNERQSLRRKRIPIDWMIPIPRLQNIFHPILFSIKGKQIICILSIASTSSLANWILPLSHRFRPSKAVSSLKTIGSSLLWDQKPQRRRTMERNLTIPPPPLRKPTRSSSSTSSIFIGTRGSQVKVQIASAPASTVKHVTIIRRRRGIDIIRLVELRRKRRSGLASLDRRALQLFEAETDQIRRKKFRRR